VSGEERRSGAGRRGSLDSRFIGPRGRGEAGKPVGEELQRWPPLRLGGGGASAGRYGRGRDEAVR
jgi:hypothetical protein